MNYQMNSSAKQYLRLAPIVHRKQLRPFSFVFVFLFTFVIGYLPVSAYAEVTPQSLEWTKQAIPIIKETAVALCGTFLNSGHSKEVKIEAGIETQVKSLLKKLADINISAGGQLTASDYVGPLQKDFAANYRDISSCNVQVSHDIQSMLQSGRILNNVDSNPYPRMPLNTEKCGNSILYYEKLAEPGIFKPQSVWNCQAFDKRKVSTANAGLGIAERLSLDQNRGQIKVTWGDTTVRWGSVNTPIFTISIRNIGTTSVHVHSINIIGTFPSTHNLGLPFFPKDYVIYPSDEILVPIGEIETLAKLIDKNYNGSIFTYTASVNSGNACQADLGDVDYVCDSKSFGFGITINFTDIFRDQYRFNQVAFIHKQRWAISSNSLKN